MIKVAIFPLGLYVKPQQQQTINAFAKLGISKLALLWNWIPLPSYLQRFQPIYLPDVFDSYREGQITTEQFRRTADFFVANLRAQDFDAAWNAQCVLTDYAKQAFDEAQQLIEQGVEVYFVSGTNPLHIQSIENQYGKPIPGIHFFSYEQKKLNNDLTKSVLDHIQQKHQGILPHEIAFLYAKPIKPYLALGPFRWLWAPFQSWFYQRAVRDVGNLHHTTRNRVTLVEQPKTAKPSLLAALKVEPTAQINVSAKSKNRPILIRRAQQPGTLRQRHCKDEINPERQEEVLQKKQSKTK